MVVLRLLTVRSHVPVIRIMILLTVIIVAGHFGIEAALTKYSDAWPEETKLLAESTLLILLLYPTLYLLVYRPLILQVTDLKRMEEERERFLALVQQQNAELQTQSEEIQRQQEELATANEELEARIEARTTELAQANEELKIEITQRQQAEVSRQRLIAILEATSDFVGIADGDGRILYTNKAGRRMVGIGEGEDVSKTSISDYHPVWAQSIIQSEGHPTALRAGIWSGETALLSRDGRQIPVSQVIIAYKEPDGTVQFTATIARDITDRKRLEQDLASRYEEAKYLADHDPVTGLLNHRAIHARLDQEMNRVRRADGQLSVMVMDIDDFKLFNDTYGHPVGDEVLQQIAALLQENARETDLVGRYGGDEFTAILPETAMEGAIVLAQRLRTAVQEHPYRTSSGLAVPLRMSFGIATYPADASQPHELIGRADANLYESKQQGGDTITTSKAPDRTGEINVGLFGVLDGLITAVDHKDHYTRKHSEHVAGCAIALAQALGLSEESQRTLRIASLLHDVGKIGIPDCVLRKPGQLDDEERAIIQQHATLGELILKEIPNLPDVVAAVRSHHERVDGLGYPRGLKDGEIPLLARIMAVADAYSAMSTDRPYHQALSLEEAKEELLRVAGTQLDPHLVRVFLRVLEETSQSGAGCRPTERADSAPGESQQSTGRADGARHLRTAALQAPIQPRSGNGRRN